MRAARLTAAVVALALLAPAARAQRSQAQAKKQELGQIQKELESTRREIDEYKKLEQALGKDLEKIESRTGDARRRMDDLRRRVGDAERKRRELKTRMASLGQASGFWKEALAEDTRQHARAFASRNEAYGRGDLYAEGFRRAAVLEKARYLAGLQGISRTTAQAEAETRRRAQELAERSRQAEKERASTQAEYDKKKAAIAEAQENLAAAVARAKELEETAKALTSLLRRLKEAPKPGKAAQQTARWDVPPNSLLWPADGTVLKPFGRQRNAELNTWVISQGILLKTPGQASVAAVRGGKVIFTGPFRSYGQVMIIDHGANVYSIYGDLGAIMKAKGADVQAGEVIASAGAPKGGEGGRVYFELRRGTEAMDPLVWLRKR